MVLQPGVAELVGTATQAENLQPVRFGEEGR